MACLGIKRHYLAVDHAFIRHRRQGLYDGGISGIEVLVVARIVVFFTRVKSYTAAYGPPLDETSVNRAWSSLASSMVTISAVTVKRITACTGRGRFGTSVLFLLHRSSFPTKRDADHTSRFFIAL